MSKTKKSKGTEVKSYAVSIPITGTATVVVEAPDGETAKEAAWKAIDDGQEPEVTWEYAEQIVKGNVFYGMQNEIDVSET